MKNQSFPYIMLLLSKKIRKKYTDLKFGLNIFPSRAFYLKKINNSLLVGKFRVIFVKKKFKFNRHLKCCWATDRCLDLKVEQFKNTL